MTSLSATTLPTLATRGITTPIYDRTALIPGVVHLGLGAFHRAHQALVFDALLAGGDSRWGVFGVAMRSTQLAVALATQDGLYAVQIASHEGTRWQIPGAMLATCVLAQGAQAVIDAIATPNTRWVTLTVTEKGYTPALSALLVQGLAARQRAGLPGLTVASCDNLSHNGRRLQANCLTAALALDPALADWIGNTCTFPNSMVDRIVPAATPERLQAARNTLGVNDTAALGTEGFWEWVIERRFVDDLDAQALTLVGVTVVDDVQPFEEAKLRLLNGSHSAMACIGAVTGMPTICDCISHPFVHRFVRTLMTEEVAPHLQRPDWQTYRDALLARFANPELKHSVHQIATDCSQKIPQRWPPSAELQLRAGASIDHLAFSAAAWMRYLEGVDERGCTYPLNDPLAEPLQALALKHANNPAAGVRALSAFPDIWGDVLSKSAPWQSRVTQWLTQIKAQGLLAAMGQLNNQPTHTLRPSRPLQKKAPTEPLHPL